MSMKRICIPGYISNWSKKWMAGEGWSFCEVGGIRKRPKACRALQGNRRDQMKKLGSKKNMGPYSLGASVREHAAMVTSASARRRCRIWGTSG